MKYKIPILISTTITALLVGGFYLGGVDEISKTKLTEKYALATEIKAKYSLDGTSLIKTEIKNPELDKYENEPKDEIKITLGDKDALEFTPKIKLERWSEVSFSLKPKGLELVADKDLKFEGDKIKFDTPKISFEMYDVPATETDEGSFKYIWYLNEPPATNRVEFDIEASGLDFFYQPPMTEEHLEEGQTADETHIYDSEGNVVAYRPENVVGSYAVYHQTKGGMNDEAGKEYKTGQAFFIYRPHIIDANGAETWGILHIENGIYSVEIPQDFLDTAVYPIKSNDTFGYTTAGGSYEFTSADRLYGSLFTPGGTGTITGISTYGTSFSETANFKGAVVLESTLNFITNGISNAAGQLYNTYQWIQATFGTNPSISTSTGYDLSFLSSTSNLVIMYNSGSANQGLYDSSNSYTTPTNPTDGSRNTKKYSIYATYTAAAGSVIEDYGEFDVYDE